MLSITVTTPSKIYGIGTPRECSPDFFFFRDAKHFFLIAELYDFIKLTLNKKDEIISIDGITFCQAMQMKILWKNYRMILLFALL